MQSCYLEHKIFFAKNMIDKKSLTYTATAINHHQLGFIRGIKPP